MPVHLAALLMLKNEEKQIGVTLKSLERWIDSLVVYDTGSTDNTIPILKEFSERTKIPLRLKQGEFVNFSVSRNIALDFSDTFQDIDFILLMDCNDQLQGGKELRELLVNEKNTETTAYLTYQKWWSGEIDVYYNMRLIKPRTRWRYKGSVHEWMHNENKEQNKNIIRMPTSIILYQDRTVDDDKSVKRYSRDKELLLQDFKKDPTEPRTLFYLAQTCSCMKQNEEAFYYYKLRMAQEGFQEEKFHAYLRCGHLAILMNHPWSDVMQWYMRAAEHSNRAEPFIRIAQHYLTEKNWFLTYSFIRIACDMEYPDKAILFVDKRGYDYLRWHIMGIVSYYVGKFEDGKRACLNAIKAGVTKDLDMHNLKFYTDKLAGKERKVSEPNVIMRKDRVENNEKDNNDLTKNEFLKVTMDKLKRDNPNLNQKQLKSKAKQLWKSRNN